VFAADDVWMDAGDQHLLVVGPVEDSDPSALRQVAGGAPEKIMLQFGRTWMLEAENLASLRVDARHHVLDRTVFSGCIHRLEN